MMAKRLERVLLQGADHQKKRKNQRRTAQRYESSDKEQAYEYEKAKGARSDLQPGKSLKIFSSLYLYRSSYSCYSCYLAISA